MGRTTIEWADYTWNPFVGCTPVSAGCAHCYARELHDKRHGALMNGKHMSQRYYEQPFSSVHLVGDGLIFDDVLKWKGRRRVFVNSMSDSFHEDLPDQAILALLAACAAAPRHTFILLTKRPERAFELLHSYSPSDAVDAAARYEGKLARRLRWERPDRRWPVWPLPNVWLGTSAEHQDAAHSRLPSLLATPAVVRFVSCEPLLGAVDLRAALCGPGGLSWVVCGAETGREARPLELDWARGLRDQCATFGVPFFFKRDSSGERLLDGVLHEAWPVDG